MKFQCSQCGACCRRMGKAGLMPDRGDGACIHLKEDNTCSIYETRPEICNIEGMFEKRKKETPLLMKLYDKKGFFILNNQYCNSFMEEDGIPKEFRIDISKYDDIQQS